MSKIIIAVDIGKKGAIVARPAVSEGESVVILSKEMPMISDELDYNNLCAILKKYQSKDVIVIFEKLGVIFGTSKTTAFSMGHQAGALEMACIALGMPYYKVSPKVWQKEMFQSVNVITKKSKSGKSNVTDTKATALLVAKQLFPDIKLTFGDRATRPHDGLVDALLMSEFARRKNL